MAKKAKAKEKLSESEIHTIRRRTVANVLLRILNRQAFKRHHKVAILAMSLDPDSELINGISLAGAEEAEKLVDGSSHTLTGVAEKIFGNQIVQDLLSELERMASEQPE